MEKKCYFINGGEHKVAKNIAIKVARAEKDMTQKVLAEAVGVSRQTFLHCTRFTNGNKTGDLLMTFLSHNKTVS